MAPLSSSSIFRPIAHSLRSAPHVTRLHPLTQIRFATQDYGSGDGHPVGENPQSAGKNPSEGLEHPGPEAPDVGQGKSGANSGGQPKDQSSGKSSGQSQGGGAAGTGSSTAEKGGQGPSTQ